MRFNHLNIPDQWQQYWTKYPEGYTMLEALINWVAQVDSMVDNVNNWNEYLETFIKDFDTDLQGTVSDILQEWQDSGFLDVVISEALQTQIDTLETQVRELAVNVKRFGAKGDGVTDDTAAIQTAIDTLKDLVQTADASYYGGGKILFPKGTYLISSRLKMPPLVQFEGVGPFASVLKAISTWTAGEYMLSASHELDGMAVIRPAVGLRNIGFDHNGTEARGFIGHALNDNCVFDTVRSYNFKRTVFSLDRGLNGGTVSQGWTVRDWQAITRFDVIEDIFVTKEANEGMFIGCKAMGNSGGISANAGFHIGNGKISEGVQLIGCSAAHLPNGKGIRFNHTRDCYAYKNTFENVLYDVYIGHDTDPYKCSKVEARGNRHYPTVNAPANHRDIVVEYALSAIVEARENAFIDIKAGAVNSQAILPTNRATVAGLPTTVTLGSDTCVVQEYHKNGVAFHHKNGSTSIESTATQTDIKLPNGSVVRSDQYNVGLISGTGVGARLMSNGASFQATSDGSVTATAAAGKPLTLMEAGANKIQLDGSGRIRLYGLTEAVPSVTNALYKDATGTIKTT